MVKRNTEQLFLFSFLSLSNYQLTDVSLLLFPFLYRLFTDSPELLQLFSFRDLDLSGDAMRNDPRLKKQALATMQHVDLAVNSLNDLGSIVSALKDLGARHTMYNVKDHHFGVRNFAVNPISDECIDGKLTFG